MKAYVKHQSSLERKRKSKQKQREKKAKVTEVDFATICTGNQGRQVFCPMRLGLGLVLATLPRRPVLCLVLRLRG